MSSGRRCFRRQLSWSFSFQLSCVQAGLCSVALQGTRISKRGEEESGGWKAVTTYLLSGEHTQLPAVTVRIMEPKAHVFRARCFGTNLVARVFNIDVDGFQVRKRLSQSRHVRQMKRHVIDRFRRRLAFKQRN